MLGGAKTFEGANSTVPYRVGTGRFIDQFSVARACASEVRRGLRTHTLRHLRSVLVIREPSVAQRWEPLVLSVVRRCPSGPRERPAKPYSRGFKSRPALQIDVETLPHSEEQLMHRMNRMSWNNS